jgi:NitT/TauT family transport system substrate-binding protein
MQDRRDFLKTGFSIAAAGLAGAVAMTGARTSLATEAPPETTSLRFEKWPVTCLAPIYIVDDLLREEGFSDIRYVPGAWVGGGDADFGSEYSGPAIIPIEGGKPIVMLAGIHPGCFELFARETIGSVLDLRGRKVGVSFIGSGEHYVLISIIAANVGLDPAKDINWVAREPREQMELFANGEVDAFLANPPLAQELRGRKFGHVILNSTLDRPWSQYFCCMLLGNTDFVRRNPVATKRVVRAVMRATDICAAKPDWVAQRLVDRDFTSNYDYARQGLEEIPYSGWRDYDPEDSVRFYALRLRELGMIKSSPDKILATGADWRFIKEVRKELGI